MTTLENKGITKDRIYLFVIFFFIVTTGAFAYLYVEEKGAKNNMVTENIQLGDEKIAVQTELNDMLKQYELMETDNVELQGEIDQQIEKIEDLIKKAKNNNWTIHKLRKETESLRGIMKGYVETIDSLNTANIELTAENKRVGQKLVNKEKQYSELSKVKDELAGKVKIGAQIEAFDLTVAAQRMKRDNEARETTRAEKAEQIRVCFTLDDNAIAKSGNKDIHLRIIDPNGRVLAEAEDNKNLFEFEGVKGLYSSKYDIIYDNAELDMCLLWKKPNPEELLSLGNYIVEVYVDDYLAGTSKLELR
jgi:hypothetical protein